MHAELIDDDRTAVRFTHDFPFSHDVLWTAVGTPEGISRWFPSTVSFEPVVGSEITFSGDPRLPDFAGRIIELVDGSRLRFGWGDNEVTIDVTPTSAGATLTLTDALGERDEAARNAAGWQVCLAILLSDLDEEHASESWADVYARYVADGWPHGAMIPDGAAGATDS